jgi:hypothetical protein
MASALVEKVRAKYGDAYADLSDDALEAAVLAKYPSYADLASPKARMGAAAESGVNRATEGALARSEAPAATLDASAFRRVEEVPSDNPAPGAPGGPPPRAASLLVPAAATAAALAPLASAATMPLAGGVEGHRLGRKVAKAAGLPEEVGGVPGAVIGAIYPGGAITAGMGEHFGGTEGGVLGLALAALARRYGLAGLGPILRAAATRLPAAAEAPVVAEAASMAPTAEAATPSLAQRFAAVSSELKAARDAGTATQLRAGAASAPAVAPAAPAVASAVTPAAPATADLTRAAALIRFARDVASRNPKIGEKIWVLLDASGAPIKTLTSDQAAAATRAGQQTTWLRNLWN